MGRRARIRNKMREEELEELEERLDKTEPGPAAEEKEEAKEAEASAPQAADGPAARVLELQKTVGNRATGAALARWPLMGAPTATAQWPKQLEMIIDGKTVVPLESAQLGAQRQQTDSSSRGIERDKDLDVAGDMVVTLKEGKWTGDLFREATSGTGYKTVEIVFPGKDGKGMRVILSDVLISSYSVSGHGGADRDTPMDSITLNFKNRVFSQDPPPKR